MAGSRPQSRGDAISMENSLEQLSTTVVRFLPTAATTETTTAAAATTTATTNKSTATTVLQKWKSKLWRPRFRWDQFEITSFFSFVTSCAFFGDKSVQVKVINFIKNKLVLQAVDENFIFGVFAILVLSRPLQNKDLFI